MDRKTIYVNKNIPSNTEPNGTMEKPYATIEEAIYSLSDDKDPEPHDLVYPENTEFICINAPQKHIISILK